MKLFASLIMAAAIAVVGCSSKPDAPAEVKNAGASVNTPALAKIPVFTFATSEYPSFAAYAHAVAVGLIDPAKGSLGEMEKKWGVDLFADNMVTTYDKCIEQYGVLACDATCLANVDTLNVALSRPTTVICPLSTSFGADRLISTTYKSLPECAGKTIKGLPASVSEFMLARAVELQGLDQGKFNIELMNPTDAGLAMQTNNADLIVVWEPDAMQTLQKNKKAAVVVDSTVIPGEIIDCLVIGNDVLSKDGGENFAKMLIDTYYTVNKRLADPQTRDETLVGLGEKFATLTGPQMADVLTRCQFYGTPEKATEIFETKYLTGKMDKVISTCVSRKIVPSAPTYGVGKSDVRLNFDLQYVQAVSKSWASK